MQPNQASNETRLPRAVLRRSAAIQARLDAAKPPAEPENTDPSAAPTGAAPAEPPPAPPAPPAPAGDPRETDPAYWKQRFSVTQGLLNSERQAHVATARERDQQITELRGQIAGLQATSAPAATIDLTKYFTPDQIERFGEEQCEVMARTAITAAAASAKDLIDAEVRPLKQQRETAQADDARARQNAFLDALTEVWPTWRADDEDPRWKLWLTETDDSTGLVRDSILQQHLAAHRAAPIARMFDAWTKSEAAASAPAPAAPVPAPRPQPPVAPSGSGAASAAAPAAPAPAGGAPTDAEVRDFYKRSALGKVKDTERVAFDARMRLRHAT